MPRSFPDFEARPKPETAMQVARSPSVELPHAVGALVDTAFVRSAVADAGEPAGTHPAALPSAWRRLVAQVHVAFARCATPG
jgi:hypothetical protein